MRSSEPVHYEEGDWTAIVSERFLFDDPTCAFYDWEITYRGQRVNFGRARITHNIALSEATKAIEKHRAFLRQFQEATA